MVNATVSRVLGDMAEVVGVGCLVLVIGYLFLRFVWFAFEELTS